MKFHWFHTLRYALTKVITCDEVTFVDNYLSKIFGANLFKNEQNCEAAF